RRPRSPAPRGHARAVAGSRPGRRPPPPPVLMRAPFLLVTLAPLLAAGCFDPTPLGGVLRCNHDPVGKSCPDGYYCAPDRTCWPIGLGPVDAAGTGANGDLTVTSDGAPPDLARPPGADMAQPPGADMAQPPGADMAQPPADLAQPPPADLAQPPPDDLAQP